MQIMKTYPKIFIKGYLFCNVYDRIGIFIPKKMLKFECTEMMGIDWNNEAVIFLQKNSVLKFGLKIRDY